MLEGDVSVWIGGGLPPHAAGYLSDFTTRYMDPTEIYQRFDELAAEFSNIAEMVPLPNASNGYQRRSQANMAGTTGIGSTPPGAQTGATVVLTEGSPIHPDAGRLWAQVERHFFVPVEQLRGIRHAPKSTERS